MKICEIFKGIQGEGRYAGIPIIFVRVSGCTRKCSYCDTKYHIKGEKMKIEKIAEKIDRLSKGKIKDICFTGGEPLLYWEEILQLIDYLDRYFSTKYKYHLETNGDLINTIDVFLVVVAYFNYIAISPKEEKVAKRVTRLLNELRKCECLSCEVDIKIVTDLEKVGKNLIKYATMLMPLTTFNKKKDLEIKKRVWEYCIKKGLRYSPRLHIDLWGEERGK